MLNAWAFCWHALGGENGVKSRTDLASFCLLNHIEVFCVNYTNKFIITLIAKHLLRYRRYSFGLSHSKYECLEFNAFLSVI